MITQQRVTWQDLVEMEPRLADLEEDARSVEDDGQGESFCANDIWYGHGPYRGIGLVQRLEGLVGWLADGSKPPLLRSSAAYDVAYRHVYNLLPDCRGDCGCGLCW